MGIPLLDKKTNANAVVTIAAVKGVKHYVEVIHASYGASPTGGNLKVESPSGTTIFEQDIIAGGPNEFDFSGSCLTGAFDQALIVTLAAGGSAIVGNLSVLQRA